MSEPDKHHYLPVFYLKQWANTEAKVVRYYRPYHAVVADLIAPKNTGYERGLYRPKRLRPRSKQRYRKKLHGPVVDDQAAQALRVLIERDLSKLTPELRQAWTRFVMSLHVRHPARVEQITQQGVVSEFGI